MSAKKLFMEAIAVLSLTACAVFAYTVEPAIDRAIAEGWHAPGRSKAVQLASTDPHIPANPKGHFRIIVQLLGADGDPIYTPQVYKLQLFDSEDACMTFAKGDQFAGEMRELLKYVGAATHSDKVEAAAGCVEHE